MRVIIWRNSTYSRVLSISPLMDKIFSDLISGIEQYYLMVNLNEYFLFARGHWFLSEKCISNAVMRCAFAAIRPTRPLLFFFTHLKTATKDFIIEPICLANFGIGNSTTTKITNFPYKLYSILMNGTEYLMRLCAVICIKSARCHYHK